MKVLIHQKKTLFQVLLKKLKQQNIKLIKTKNISKPFRFSETNTDEIKRFIEKLNPKRASKKSDMRTNILKKNAAFFAK